MSDTNEVKIVSVPMPKELLGKPVQMWVHAGQDAISKSIVMHRQWQPSIGFVIRSVLRPGDTFVDVGAHIGYFSLLGASRVGAAGRVIAFEPDPANFAILQRNAQGQGLAPILGHRKAVSDQVGETTFFMSPGNPWDSSLQPDEERNVSITVPMTTLAESLADVERLRLIKLDTQGAEDRAIRGLLPLLEAREQHPYLIIEVLPSAYLNDPDKLAILEELMGRHLYTPALCLSSGGKYLTPTKIPWPLMLSLFRNMASSSPKAETDLILYPRRPAQASS